jgi:hypothetical protein
MRIYKCFLCFPKKYFHRYPQAFCGMMIGNYAHEFGCERGGLLRWHPNRPGPECGWAINAANGLAMGY